MKSELKNTSRYCRYFLLAAEKLAVLFFLYLLYTAFINPYIPWDSWGYHLPSASFLWNIGGGKEGFIPTPFVQNIYAGYPLFGEWLQGALWVLFDDVRATSLINPLALILFCVSARVWLGVRISCLLLAALAFPLIAIHVTSTYKDLYVGALIATSVVAAARIYQTIKEDSLRLFSKRNFTAWVLFCCLAAAASNSKVQAWVILIPYIGFFGLILIRITTQNKHRLLIASIMSVQMLACSYTQIINFAKYSHPFYPYIMHSRLHLQMSANAGEPSSGATSHTGLPVYAGNSFFSGPVYFLTSLSEIDHILRNVALKFSLDMYSGNPYDQIRTGGLWGLYVIFHVGLLFALSCLSPLNRTLNPAHRFVFFSFGVVTLAVLLMPRSNDLRYVLVWPLLLALCTGIYSSLLPDSKQLLLHAVLLLFLVVGQTLISDRTLFPKGSVPGSPEEWRAEGSQAIISRLHDGTTTCLETDEMGMLLWFRYSAAVIGGTHTINTPKDFSLKCDPAAPNRWNF